MAELGNDIATSEQPIVSFAAGQSTRLAAARDELAGWDRLLRPLRWRQWRRDAAHWLSMPNGESIIIDRKTGNPRTIYVPQASVSVTGGIQPTILHRALGLASRIGMATRFFLRAESNSCGQ